jgi:LmbE family N-acetylglucosaminyl deacetylase
MDRRIMLISPHADDELLGAACTLMKKKEEGASIRLVLVCCSDIEMRHQTSVVSGEDRRLEFLESAKILSTEDPVIFGFPDSLLDQNPLSDLVTLLDHQLDEFKPDVLFIPEPSYHQDHRYVNLACLAALRPTGKHAPSRVLAYEVPTSTSSIGCSFSPNYYVVADDYLDKKLDIFEKCYGTQYTDSGRGALAASGIRRHALYRGIEIGSDAAEAFMLLREID